MTRISLGTDSGSPDMQGTNRRVGLLSDGRSVVGLVRHDGFMRLYVSNVGRTSFTEAVATAFSAAEYFTMHVDELDNVHMSWNNSNGDLRYLRYDRTGTTTYVIDDGPNTVVVNGGTVFSGRRDIGVTPGGSVFIIVLTYVFAVGEKVKAKIYFCKYGSNTWTQQWASGTEVESDVNLIGACSIAIDNKGLEADTENCFFCVTYQLVSGKPLYIRSVRLNQETGAATSWVTILALNGTQQATPLNRTTSAQAFTVSNERWVILGAIGHRSSADFTRPFAVTCNRTAVLRRVDGAGGVDGMDPYGFIKEGAYPAFALIRTAEGYRAGVMLTANVASASESNRGVQTRTIPLDSNHLPGVWKSGVKLITGGFSFIAGGAQPRYNSSTLDAVMFRRSTNIHYYIRNAISVAPTGVLPRNGATVVTAIPRLSATLASLSGGLAVGLVRGEWNTATNAGFTSGAETTIEPVTSFRGSGSHSAYPVSPLTSGTRFLRARAHSEFGTYGPYSAGTSFLVAHPPSLSQLNPTGFVKNGQITFSAVFSDPYVDDEQTAIQVEVRADAGATVVFDSGKVTGPTVTHGVWTGYLNEQLSWRAKAWDVDDTEGVWSNSAFMVIDDGLTVALETIPSTSPTPTITWTSTGNRPQSSWQIQVRRTSDNFLLYVKSGQGLAESYTIEDQTVIANGQEIKIVLRLQDTGLIMSEVFQIVTFSWIPPEAPPFTVLSANFEETGKVIVSWNDEPREVGVFLGWRVYRKSYGIPTWELLYEQMSTAGQDAEGNYYFEDRFAPQNVYSEWAVVQVVERFDAAVESAIVPVHDLPVGSHYWLVSPVDPDFDIKLYNVTANPYVDTSQREELMLIGRGTKVEVGTHLGKKGSLTANMWDWEEVLLPHYRRLILEGLQLMGSWVWLRTPFGDVWKVATGDIQYTPLAGTGTIENLQVVVPYTEVQ